MCLFLLRLFNLLKIHTSSSPALLVCLLVLSVSSKQAMGGINVSPFRITGFPIPSFDATPLANALLGSSSSGINVTSSTMTDGASLAVTNQYTHGFYTLTGTNNYGLTRDGIVLSTGNVLDYASGNDTRNGWTTEYRRTTRPTYDSILSSITGHSVHRDVAALELIFDVGFGTDRIDFDVVFGSEEYPTYVNSFVDGFGLILNGTNIAFAAGSPININHPAMKKIAETELNAVLAPVGVPVMRISSPVVPGSKNNKLEFILGDTRDAAYDSTIYISGLTGRLENVPDISVTALRNFDILTPADTLVNDFHVTLKGVQDPSMINHLWPRSFSANSPLPPGWNDRIIDAGEDTIIKWGPGQNASFGQKLHFGMGLTPAGAAELEGICLNWTKDGQPVFEGGNPNLPVTVTAHRVRPGEVNIQIASQNCPEHNNPNPTTWLGNINVNFLPREVDLEELVGDNPIVSEAEIFAEGPFELPHDGLLTFKDIDQSSPISGGESIVVWYDVYEDNGGVPGQLIGTSYTAFNAVIIPEPSSSVLLLLATSLIATVLFRQP